mgnify:CR=1 FL=1
MTRGSGGLVTVDEAAAILRDGGVCALPTETVYGLAALASEGEAVARIYDIKGRPRFNPLIVHCASSEEAARTGRFGEAARRLADAFWPGPLTLVLPRRETAAVAELASAGLATIAVRIPAHTLTREVIGRVGAPLVAPSANRSGRLSPTCAAHVLEEFAGRIPVVDGGPCAAGIESTIVGLAGPQPVLLRPGAIPAGAVEDVLGTTLEAPGSGIEAPGMMTSHYAPEASLRLAAGTKRPGEVLLGFGGTQGADLDLSPAGDLQEAAANLFGFLRQLDSRAKPIAVAAIPDEGLGRAINDRLRRAAAPRP